MKLARGVVNYFKEVRFETDKVTWPTRAQTIRLTVLVIIVSVFVGAFVGGLDFVFSSLLKFVLTES